MSASHVWSLEIPRLADLYRKFVSVGKAFPEVVRLWFVFEELLSLVKEFLVILYKI